MYWGEMLKTAALGGKVFHGVTDVCIQLPLFAIHRTLVLSQSSGSTEKGQCSAFLTSSTGRRFMCFKMLCK